MGSGTNRQDEAIQPVGIPDGSDTQDTSDSPRGLVEQPATAEEIASAVAEIGIPEPFEEEIARLPEDQKLQALLGITREVDIVQVLFPFRAITIKTQRSAFRQIQEAIGQLALPCSSDFLGGTSDDTITLTYIAASLEAVDRIQTLMQEIDPSSEIKISEESTTLAVKIPRSRLISVAHLGKKYEPKEEPSEAKEEELAQRLQFTSLHETVTSLHAAKEDKKTGTRLPQKGHCTYMMIAEKSIRTADPENPEIQKLMDEIEMVRESDHFHITAYGGYIVMIGTSERSGSSLTAMAHRFFRSIPQSYIFLGTGDITHENGGKFSIEGFPTDTQQAEKFRAAPSGIFLTEEFHSLITDPTRRDSALCSIEKDYNEELGLHRLLSFRPKASARIGGPDRFIGKDKELKDAEAILSNRRNRLTVMQGPAFIGKSRFIHELLGKLPGAVYCSVDPLGKESNAPGFGLMSVAEQIADKFKDEPQNSPKRRHKHAEAIRNFATKTQKEKLDDCTENPEKITDMCFNALVLLGGGHSVFVMDDFHHADRASVNPLARLAERYMEAGGKVILAMREEEIHVPEAVRALETSTTERFRTEATARISVTGLNFSDDNIARDFAYYSFPEKIREGKVLGHWYKKLAKAAGTNPGIMKTLMDGIIADEEYEIHGDTILLKQNAETLIEEIISKNKDLNTYYRRRVKGLGRNAQTLLQCVALAGGQVTAAKTIEIAAQIGLAELGRDLVREARQELIKGRHLIPSEDETAREEDRIWELQHPTIRDIVIESIDDSNRKFFLLHTLHKIFSRDSQTPADVKLSIALQIANDERAPDINAKFWETFTHDVRASLEEAREMQTTGRAYQIATSSITGEKAPEKIREARKAMLEGRAEELPNHLFKDTITTALLDTAEAAVALSRFDEAEACIQELETINGKNKDLNIDMARAYSILFQIFYLQIKIPQMKVALDKLRGTNRGIVQVRTAEIKLAFREHRWKDLHEIFEGNKAFFETADTAYKREHKDAPSPEYMEIQRLVHCRSEFERLRKEIKETLNLDDDIELQAGIISAEDAGTLLEIQTHLNRLLEERKRHPRSFTPHCEIPLLEQAGICLAYLGKHEEALSSLNEAWRVCDQVEFHKQGARIAKLIMDVLAMMAISRTEVFPTKTTAGRTVKRRVIQPTHLFQALEVRKKQGMAHLALINDENNFYHLGIRADAIRSVGIIACTYENRVEEAESALKKAQLRKELEETVLTAFKDWKDLNRISKAQKSAGKSRPYHEDPEIINAVSPYMGHIIELAQKLEIPVPEQILNPEESPFINQESLRQGFEYGRTLNDTGLGEIQRRQDGYSKLANMLLRQKQTPAT